MDSLIIDCIAFTHNRTGSCDLPSLKYFLFFFHLTVSAIVQCRVLCFFSVSVMHIFSVKFAVTGKKDKKKKNRKRDTILNKHSTRCIRILRLAEISNLFHDCLK